MKLDTRFGLYVLSFVAAGLSEVEKQTWLQNNLCGFSKKKEIPWMKK